MSQTQGMTVEEAAAQIFSVEQTPLISETENAPFERRFANSERNPFLGWNPAPHSIRSYQIPDAVLDGEFRGLFNSRGFIRGTGYLVRDDFMITLGIDKARLVQVPEGSTVIIGCNVAHRNYFHWTTQALPAIDFSLRRLAQVRNVTLALPTLNSWQEESLRLLGCSEVKRFVVDDPEKQYVFNRVEFSELLNGGAAFCLSKAAFHTYAVLRRSVEIPSLGRKIYIARTDAPNRRMRNEHAIIEEARKRGYEIVVPGTLTFAEQIRLFRDSSIVVGTHGAGMTNIVFCEPGTLVYELLPSHYTNACFCNLAHICKLRYWADSFKSAGDGLPNLRCWESDTTLVTERLDEIDAVFADLRNEAKPQVTTAMDFLRGRPYHWSTCSDPDLSMGGTETAMRRPHSPEVEARNFSARVLSLIETGQPVKIQVGFGWTPARGFVNLDITPLLDESDTRLSDVDVFYFPFADMPWPIPANCVDYIFHEDFIEHISQKQQVCFLAETLRVLKDGGWHRVSTPCLNASMQRHSRFADGMEGVYIGEWDNWQHINLFTRHSLEDMAKLVGYRDVVFNLKDQGVSPYRLSKELRPGPDRDPLTGNIFGDLLKLGRPEHAERRLESMLEVFDEMYYVASNSDVADAMQTGWLASGRDHYVHYGFKERRAPFALDPIWYAAQYPLAALEVAYGNYSDFTHHYVAAGKARGYRPTPA